MAFVEGFFFPALGLLSVIMKGCWETLFLPSVEVIMCYFFFPTVYKVVIALIFIG